MSDGAIGDQLNALRLQVADGGGVETVAFLHAAGNVGDHIRTLGAQKFIQQAGG